mgnify:CR=1 FL=1
MKKWYLFVCLIIFFGCDRPPLIKDYKIEKIGVGDSLLNIISKEEIEKQISNPEKNYDILELDPPNKFVPIIKKNNLDTYYELEIFIEPNDNKYIVKAIHGRMSNINLNLFLDKKSKIGLEFSDMFKNAKREEDSIFKPDSRRTVYDSTFTFKDGNEVKIQCYSYSELNIPSNNHLVIGISSKEISDWLSTWKDQN